MSSYDVFKGLWRASAHEAVPHTEDFPEALLVTPEFWDGSILQGNATVVKTVFKWLDNSRVQFKYEDNGAGIKNERRLLQWAAPNSVDTMHRNGHGLKKAMTKYMREYDSAKWTISYRKKNKNLQVIHSPFLGPETVSEEDEYEDKALTPSGTQITFDFDVDVLGKYESSPQALFHALRELLTTRYSEQVLRRIDFQLEILKDDIHLRGSSKLNEWHSFEWHLQQRIPRQVKLVFEHTEIFPGGRWNYKEYFLHVPGNTTFDLKNNEFFPVYGRKNQSASRVHTFLEDRMIEAIPFHKVLGRGQSHNDDNGRFAIWTFSGDHEKMPQPATTKVSFYENDQVFKEALLTLNKRMEDTKDKPAPPPPNPPPSKPKPAVIVPLVPPPTTVKEAGNSERAFFRKLKSLKNRLNQLNIDDEIRVADTERNPAIMASMNAIERILKTIEDS